jgi:cell shape-determining protein MreC
LLELRFMATNADIEVGDVLTTSGVDGVYPQAFPVAKRDQGRSVVQKLCLPASCASL